MCPLHWLDPQSSQGCLYVTWLKERDEGGEFKVEKRSQLVKILYF